MSKALVATALEWLRAFNDRELSRLLDLYAEDAVHVSPKLREKRPDSGGKVVGRAALQAWWEDAFRRLPGLRYEPLALTADGERVWMEYRRIAPGEPAMMVAEVLVMRDGKIVESRVYHG